jgi:hypothetical protein
MPRSLGLTTATAAAALLLVLPLPACRDKTETSSEAGVFPLRPNPVGVGVSRDSSHSARATVTMGGATITAVGGDGSHFTLTIPPNALPTDTVITLTPVSSIAGLPLSGGLAAAVQMEPEGLYFNRPVVLRIEPERPVPPAERIGFGYLRDGDDFHPYPVDSGSALQMRLLHFSGAGVALGTSAEASALAQRAPASAQAQLEQKIWELLEGEHQRQIRGEPGDPQLAGKLSRLLEDFYDQVVLPKLDAARNADDWRVMFDAIQTATFFARMSNLLGEDQSALAKLLPRLEPILVRGYEQAYQRCIRKLGGDKEARLLMIVTRNAAVTMFGISQDDPRFSQKKLQECYGGGFMLPEHLELSFEATILLQEYESQILLTAGSTMQLDQTPGSTTYYTRGGFAPVTYRGDPVIGGSGCPAVKDLKLHDGRASMSLFVHPDGHIAASGLSVEFQKGPWEEWTTDLCDGRTHPENDTIGLWARALNTLEGVLTKENPPGYAGVSTGMTFFPSPGNLSSTIERTDYSPMYKKGVIRYHLKVLP